MAEAKERHVYDYDHYSYSEYGNGPQYRVEVVGQIGEMGMPSSLIASMNKAELLHYQRSLRHFRGWYGKRLDVAGELVLVHQQLQRIAAGNANKRGGKLAKQG